MSFLTIRIFMLSLLSVVQEERLEANFQANDKQNYLYSDDSEKKANNTTGAYP